MLHEGVDVNMLGQESPGPLNRSYNSSVASIRSPLGPRSRTKANTNTPTRLVQPGTPVVVPPTPTPHTNSATGTLSPAASSSTSTTSNNSQSQQDVFYDAVEDNNSNERQTNRRSLYRSPGTSSSPDLATLLRKAKERGGVMNMQQYKSLKEREKKREEPAPPLPPPHDRPSTASSSNTMGRPRSSTSASHGGQYHSGPSSLSPDGRSVKVKDDWVQSSSSPRVKEAGVFKGQKSSMRAKTSAFWGKVMGTNTLRERASKSDLSALNPVTPTYSSSSLLDAFTPPVPQIPDEHRALNPQSTAESNSSLRPNMAKPLPPIVGSSARESRDTTVFVEKSPLPAKEPVSISKTIETVGGTITPKRRSMSVGDVELKKALANSANAPLPPTPTVSKKHEKKPSEDPTLHTILDQFKGELSQLESTATLDLQDPSTPARQVAYRRRKEEMVPSALGRDGMFTPKQREEGIDPTVVPPRTSSLQLPNRSASGPPTTNNSPRLHHTIPSNGLLKPRPFNGLGSPRDTNRLRVLHRSTASSSEPSLLPIIDDARKLSQRRSSQQELSVKELTLTRFPSSSQSLNADDPDLEKKGRELARKCWDEDEEFLAKEKIAEWLGKHGHINKVALRYYMENFDFSDLRLDVAFRRLCQKLFLKGETQQVDRILEEFSKRYWDCNSGGLYGSANIVHAVSYSLLLLNTDLHVAELTSRMSRSQFVKNTMTAIQVQLRPSLPAALSSSDLTYDDCASSIRGAGSDDTETQSRSKRSDSIASWNSVPRDVIVNLSHHGPSLGAGHNNGSTPSIQASSSGHDYRRSSPNPVYGRTWEDDMESLLKEMYNAIKSQQILQPLNTGIGRASTSSLSPGTGIMRNRSFRTQNNNYKRGSIRGWQSILSGPTGISPYSSNSSIDGRASPAPSFATSAHEAMYGSTPNFLTPTLGFAHNLSHTIIREAQEDDDRSINSEDSDSTTISISDEELALLGAPWAKEGMLCRKYFCEPGGKRAKDKSWLDVFVVIQKGELNMFTFGDHNTGNSGTVGGGNWLANANPVGILHLTHSLAHALPPPGYDRHRPYCMVLTLSNGGVYFFQAGTEELVNEWVSTCNYWAARVSKEPLAGGVSNMEYGWNRVLDPYGHGRSASNNETSRDTDPTDTMSIRSGRSGISTRSGRYKFGWKDGTATVRASNSPWQDKMFIADWTEPMPPTMASTHDEETQLDALKKHVVHLKVELTQHNELRSPMMNLYQPGGPNARKAQTNWERKSKYTLKEIVKYESYIDSLEKAMTLRLKKRGEKALERALNGATPNDESFQLKGKWKGPEEATIREEREPLTPGSSKLVNSSTPRKREEDEDEDDTDTED